MPTEAPNTLRSRAKFKIVDIISQGPTKGLFNGAKSIYLDETPVQNEDGTYNFPNFDVSRDLQELPVTVPTGSTKPIYPGMFPSSENEVSVAAKVTKDNPEGGGSGDGSVTRTITDASLDALRITMRVPALTTTNTTTGDITGGTIRFNIYVKPNGGVYAPVSAGSQWESLPAYNSETDDGATGIEVTATYPGGTASAAITGTFQYRKKTGGTWGDWITFGSVTIPKSTPSSDKRGYYNNYMGAQTFTRSVTNLVPGIYQAQVVSNKGITGSGARQFIENALEIQGKTVSAYDASYLVNLPDGGAPWDVKVVRTSDDNVAANIQDDLYWFSYTEIIDNRFSWPNIDGVRLSVDAESFGGNVPNRSYDYMGLLVQIPANYDPYERTYTGVWNGTFKTDWTDNPAWIFYDLLTNKRYGLGDNIDATQIDKYALYAIAQYCDELVDAPNGEEEPRYTCSCVINSQSEAYELLTAIASAFRGMIYHSGGMITPVADMPSDPVLNVGPANVIDGTFTYQGASRKARHTVARVSWNNPDDGYKLNVELYEDTEAIRKYGYRPVDINAFGCTSRGLARRWGKWAIVSDNDAPDTVTYKAGFDHFSLRPGDVINIADPNYSGEQLFGLIESAVDNVSPATHTITLDRAVTRVAGDTSELQLTLADGTILALDVAVLTNTTSAEITVDSSELTTVPLAGASWLLKKGTVEPRQWRVISISEDEPHIYQVTAMLYDPNKYDSIETGLNFAEADFTAFPSGPLPAPTGLAISEFLKQSGSAILECATFSWVRPADARAELFEVQYQEDGKDWQATTPNLTGVTSVDIINIVPGTYNFRVRAQDASGIFRSEWATLASQTLQGKSKAPEDVTGFTASVEKFGVLLSWNKVSDIDIDYYEIRTGASWAAGTTIGKVKATTFKFEDATTGAYTFWIKALDAQTPANESATAASTSATVSAQAAPSVVATAVNGGIQLTISGTTTRGFRAYEIQRRESPSGTEATINSNVLTKIFTDTDIVTLGYVKSWQYRARALDQNGSASGWSDFTAATTPKQIENDDITANQIIAKHFTTHLDVGIAQDGVLFNSGGIQAWCDGVKTVDIPVSGNPTFNGTVTAGAGFVGGWCIETGRLCAQNASLYSGLANVARVEMGTGSYSAGINSANAGTDISFWAGSTFVNRATAPFNVLANGAMTASKGTVGGWCIEANCLHSTNVLMASNGTLQTKNFTSGNRGWKIDQFGMAEFNDVRARGSIKTTVFEKDEISVVGGRTLIRPAGVVSCYDYAATLNASACVALTARWAQLTCLLGYSSAMPTTTFADYAEYYAAEAEYYRQTAIALGCAIYQTSILEADYSDIAKDAYFTDCWNLLNEILDTTEIVPTFASMSYSDFIAAEESYFDSMSEVLDDPRPFEPAISENDTVVYLDDVDSFDVGDIVRIKDSELAGDYWSRVTGTGSDINGCYLNLSWLHGDLFPMTSGQAAVNYGITGSGGILLDGQAPAIDVYTHDGMPWLGTNLWLRLGNLAGWGTINHNVFGIAVGLPEANHMSYRADTGVLSITGAINITGGSGIANFTDAGALATASDLDDVPNGATYYKTTANEVTGAGRAYSGLDANNMLVTAVIPASAVTPAGEGLFLGSNYLGFYSGGWKTYMDNAGNFALVGGGTHGLSWNATSGVLTIAGSISILGGSGYGNLTDKPTNLAGINSTEGGKLTGIAAGADVTANNTAYDTARVAGVVAATVKDNAANALANAASANKLLADIAADNKLVSSEKHSVRKEWDIIASEKAGINSQATTFGITTENTNYNNAFQALANYLNAGSVWSSGIPSWIADANLSTTTDIVGATFRSTWKAYYDTRTILLNAIAAKAKALADAAQGDATDALADAAAAQGTADSAVTAATAANDLLADIAADNKLVSSEKHSVRKEWDIIAAEQPINSLHAMSIVGFTAGLPSAGFNETVSDAYWSGAWTLLNTLLDESNAEPAFAAQTYAAFVAEESTYYTLVKQVIDSEIITVPPTPDVLALNTAYVAAFQALANYLNAGSTWSSGVPSWISDANISATTDITGSTFRSTWKAYYDARTALLNAIASRAQIIADLAQAAAGSVSLRVDSTLDVNNNLITAVIPKSAVVPIGPGLFLGSDYLGYYNGSTWKTYMDRSGNFYLGGSSAGCGLAWDSAKNCLTICGCVTSSEGNIAGWNINSKCLSKGNLILNSDGAISGCYSGDVSGWCIDAAGNAKFNNAIVCGTVCASEGCIAGWSLNKKCISKGNLILNSDGALSGCYSGDTTGWCIDAAGNAKFNNAIVRGTVCASQGCIGCFVLDNGALKSTVACAFSGITLCHATSASDYGQTTMLPIYLNISQNYTDQLIFSRISAGSMNNSITCYCSGGNSECSSGMSAGAMSFTRTCSGSYVCSSVSLQSCCNGSSGTEAPFQICVYAGTSCYGFYTNGRISVNDVVCTSDRNLKTDFQDINVLELLRQMPITKWRFKDSKDYQVGPMAQDFNDIFRLANNWQTNLTVGGLDGIALKAIKEVDENVQTHDKCIVMLKEKLQKLECEMAAIREMIN